MSGVAYAKRAEYKPVDILFRGAVDAKSKAKKVIFVDAVVVLNDRYLGRMYPNNYFAVAENTVRINELTLIAVEELKNYHLVMRENFLIPDKTVYCLPISARFLDTDKDFDILLSSLKNNGYKKGSIILSFFGISVDRFSAEAKKRYMRLRRAGYKTAVSQFGEDYNSIDIFAGVAFDYLRCDANYFDATPNKKKLLTMLIRFCNANKIVFVMDGVDNAAQYTRFAKAGVKIMTGNAASKLSQWVSNKFLGLPDLEGEKKSAYISKLKKELDLKERSELAELERLRKISLEKAKENAVDGIMPANPRPEIEKSPYVIRLEKQRELASKCAVARLKALAELADEWGDNEEEMLYDEWQNENAEAERNESANGEENISDGIDGEQKSEELNQSAENVKSCEGNESAALAESVESPELAERAEQHTDADGRAYVTKRESGIAGPVRPHNDNKVKAKKTITADLNAEAKLLNEYRNSGIFGGLGQSDGFTGFGITMKVETAEDNTPPLVGKYNDKGQWVDENGNVFDGYFDADGKWTEYEKLDIAAEGHYNDYGQWVDADGITYDGYFDEQGRWIDYTYADANGEPVDNGYFDNKIGKWVAFGYFDAKGGYHRF